MESTSVDNDGPGVDVGEGVYVTSGVELGDGLGDGLGDWLGDGLEVVLGKGVCVVAMGVNDGSTVGVERIHPTTITLHRNKINSTLDALPTININPPWQPPTKSPSLRVSFP